MKRILTHTGSQMLLFAILLFTLFSSCSDDFEEPATYTPQQIRRLLMGDSTKLWVQRTDHYLEEDCHTGHLLRFSNLDNDPLQPFGAFFYPEPGRCDESQLVFKEAIVRRQMPYQTTDSLFFVNDPGDTTRSLIRVLTHQQLQLDLIDADGMVHRAEYWLVEEEDEE